MALIKPYFGLSKDRLVNLINSDNQTSLELGVDFDFGSLSSISGNGGRNTTIELLSANQGSFTNTNVNYTRLLISVLGLLPATEIDYVNLPKLPTSTHAVLEEINRALGLSLEATEVEDITYSEANVQYPLTIKAGSMAWLPSTYYFKARTEDMMLTESNDPLLTEYGFPFELETA